MQGCANVLRVLWLAESAAQPQGEALPYVAAPAWGVWAPAVNQIVSFLPGMIASLSIYAMLPYPAYRTTCQHLSIDRGCHS